MTFSLSELLAISKNDLDVISQCRESSAGISAQITWIFCDQMAVRRGLVQGLQLKNLIGGAAEGPINSAAAASACQQVRYERPPKHRLPCESVQHPSPLVLLRFCRGANTVPEFYGKPSPYSAGTGFLGTPPDHREVRLRHL